MSNELCMSMVPPPFLLPGCGSGVPASRGICARAYRMPIRVHGSETGKTGRCFRRPRAIRGLEQSDREKAQDEAQTRASSARHGIGAVFLYSVKAEGMAGAALSRSATVATARSTWSSRSAPTYRSARDQ